MDNNKILVIDDNNIVRYFLIDKLTMENYEVFEAENGKKCYDLGVNGFLRKPCESYELLGLVRQTMMLKQLQSELAQQHDRFGEAITECTANLRVSSCNLDRLIQALSDDYEDKLDEIGPDYLDRMRTESQRVVQLVDDLFSLKRGALHPQMQTGE